MMGAAPSRHRDDRGDPLLQCPHPRGPAGAVSLIRMLSRRKGSGNVQIPTEETTYEHTSTGVDIGHRRCPAGYGLCTHWRYVVHRAGSCATDQKDGRGGQNQGGPRGPRGLPMRGKRRRCTKKPGTTSRWLIRVAIEQARTGYFTRPAITPSRRSTKRPRRKI